MAIKIHPSLHVHPGIWLRTEIVEAYDLTDADAADVLGVTPIALSDLLGGKSALSADMAVRFEMAFGLSADTMMRMQAAYDVAQVRMCKDKPVVTRIAKVV